MKLSEFPFQSEISVIEDADVQSFALINDTKLENYITYLDDPKYLASLYDNERIAAVCTTFSIAEKIDKQSYNRGLVCVEKNPKKTFYQLHNHLFRLGIFYKAFCEKTTIEKDADIDRNAIIASKGVKIGSGTRVDAGAVILPGTTIGENCYIGANTTIGTRGFQFYRDSNEIFYIEHVGGVIIGDRVDIFSNSCVACGLFRPTVIGDDVKIDNHVHISHSDIIGKKCLIPAGVSIAGSVEIGDEVWIGLGSSIKQQTEIGARAFITMDSAVFHDVRQYEAVSGNPAKVIGQIIVREDGSVTLGPKGIRNKLSEN